MKRLIVVIFLLWGCGLTASFGEAAVLNPMDIVAEVAEQTGYTILTADEDTLIGEPADYAIIVAAKDENCILIVLNEMDDEWKIETNTTTRTRLYPLLYQNADLVIRKNADMQFSLLWPGESYTFKWIGTSWRLIQAEFSGDKEKCIVSWIETKNGSCLKFQNEKSETYWQQGIGLSNFNPMLFPKTCSDARRQNELLSIMDRVYIDFTPSTRILGHQFMLQALPLSDSMPVDISNFADEEIFHLYGLYDGWALISYQVGYDRTFFGYVDQKAFSFSDVEISNLASSCNQCTLQVCKDTFLTDDPFLSQTPVCDLSEQTRVVGLCVWDSSYAYVEANIDEDIIRGFVPLQALVPVE